MKFHSNALNNKLSTRTMIACCGSPNPFYYRKIINSITINFTILITFHWTASINSMVTLTLKFTSDFYTYLLYLSIQNLLFKISRQNKKYIQAQIIPLLLPFRSITKKTAHRSNQFFSNVIS